MRWFLCTGFLFVIKCDQALAAGCNLPGMGIKEWAETATGTSSTGDRKMKWLNPVFVTGQGKDYHCRLCTGVKYHVLVPKGIKIVGGSFFFS